MKPAPTSDHLRVLLADCVIVRRAVLHSMLTDRGYRVTTASSGQEAAVAILSNSYDLAFLELQLPDKSAFEVTRDIRPCEKLCVRRTAIAGITSDPESSELVKCCRDAGMDACISLPMPWEDFFAVIDQIMMHFIDQPKRTLLWVEDDSFIRQRLTPKLEDEGFTVLAADNAETALTVFAQCDGNIDVAVLDVMMPAGNAFDEKETMGGFETGVALARWIHKQNPDIPLVAFSISTEPDATKWFFQHGAAFVQKSYDGADLIECLKTLQAKQEPEDETLSFVEPASLAHPPQRIARYEIHGELGRGAMGIVFLGWDEELQRKVAIKSPRRERFRSHEELERFVEEARIAAKLKHPMIVSIHDILHASDGTPCLIMEYVDGTSLRKLMDSEELVYRRVRALIAAIAEALQFAHAAGFTHCDIKPGNILIDERGNPKLTDFGLAIREETQRRLAGTVAGSLAYMAPEQIRGETHHIDGRTDIWGLGVVLYEMLVGRRPFSGDKVVDEILNREPDAPRMIDDSVPADLENICLKCLRKPVAERYLTARDLLRDLASESGVIDWDRILAFLKGNRHGLHIMIDTTLHHIPRISQAIREGLTKGDILSATISTHTLKGNIRWFGPCRAFDLLCEMEESLREGDLPNARELLPAVEMAVSLFVAELVEYKNRTGPWKDE